MINLLALGALLAVVVVAVVPLRWMANDPSNNTN